MAALRTDAIVLHAFDYLESSRILRLVTRDGGVRSVLARGARRSSRRFGSALDLFAQGVAELHQRPGRDLDTLASFEVTRSRAPLGLALSRFTGASALSELILRFAQTGADPHLFDAIAGALDRIEGAAPEQAREATLGGAWAILAELGFSPSLERCSECDREIAEDDTVLFSHPAGGALCTACSRARVGRPLPAAARLALRSWLAGAPVSLADVAEGRAHQRLLREFVLEHITDGRPLRAFEVWEQASWSAG